MQRSNFLQLLFVLSCFTPRSHNLAAFSDKRPFPELFANDIPSSKEATPTRKKPARSGNSWSPFWIRPVRTSTQRKTPLSGKPDFIVQTTYALRKLAPYLPVAFFHTGLPSSRIAKSPCVAPFMYSTEPSALGVTPSTPTPLCPALGTVKTVVTVGVDFPVALTCSKVAPAAT